MITKEVLKDQYLTFLDVIDDVASVCCLPNMKYDDFIFTISMRFSGILYLLYFSEEKITLLQKLDITPHDIELLWVGF